MHICFFSFMFFFFFLLYFFLFLFFFYICSILLHVKFEDADNQKLTLRQQTQDFGLYNTINRHFFTIYRTGENISVHSRKRIGTFIFFIYRRKHFCSFQLRSTKNRTWEFGLTNSPSLLNYALTQRFKFCMLLQV